MRNNDCCICGHTNKKHEKTGPKSWERFDQQLEGYVEHSLKDREQFWREYLTNLSSADFKCSVCNCVSFRRDNLKWLEKQSEIKK